MEGTRTVAWIKMNYDTEFRFSIDHKFPGMNEIIAKAKKGFRKGVVYANSKKKNTGIAVSAIVAVNPPLDCSKIYASFEWCVANGRRDPDNIAAAVKFIFDAFVIVGVVKRDSQQYVRGWDNKFTQIPKKKPRQRVTVFRAEDYVNVTVYCQRFIRE